MQKIISIAAVCPLWASPSYKSEMTSQLLFGEQATILETTRDFFLVKCENDGYEGWIMQNQVLVMPENDTPILKGFTINGNAVAILNSTVVPLPIGSPVYQDFGLNNIVFNYSQTHYCPINEMEATVTRAVQIALAYINTPYLWGGKSNFGADCSGFVQQVFKLMGIFLPKDARAQVNEGKPVDFLQQAQPGDLAFFDNEQGEIIHVGILLSSQQIIHASGFVHTDLIDTLGIVSTITGNRTHQLRIIKRLF